MKIAVIIPIFNVEKYLNNCIDSILRQSNRNFELILVDDGSTDNSGKICDEYLENKLDIVIKVIHKKNGGLVSAWKKGVSVVSSDCTHILFVNPDDWVSDDYLSFLYKRYLNSNADIIITSITKVQGRSSTLVKFPIANGTYTSKNIDTIYSHLLNNGGFFTRGLPVNRWGKLLKKDLVIKNMHYVSDDVTFAEDLNLIFPMIIKCSTIEVVQNSSETYYYRIRKDSMLRKYDANMWNSISKVYSTLMSISGKTNNLKLIQQVNKDYVGAVNLCYKNNLENTNGLKEALRFITILHTDSIFMNALKDVNLREYSYIDRLVISAITTNNKILKICFFYVLKEMKSARNALLRN